MPDQSEPLKPPEFTKIRHGPAFSAWFQDVVERKGRSKTAIIDEALRLWAKVEGEPDPPAR